MAETGPAEPTTPPAPAAGPERHPPQVTSLAVNQACERFSYHGTSSILTVYMVSWLLYDARDAKANYHAFMMATSLTPLLGGWIADRFLGRYRTILSVSLLSLAGLATLVAWPTRTGLLVGLGLVALGAGGLRSCVTAFLGDQLEPGRGALLERISFWFTWVVSLGAVSARLLVPGLLRAGGPALAFAVPGALMALSLAVLWLGRGTYRRLPPAGPRPDGFLRVTWRALRRLGTGRPGEHWLDAARDRHPAEAVEGAKAVFRVMGILAVVPVFWSLFDQTGSSWTLQARAMDLSMGAWSLDPSQLQAANPLFVMGLVPLATWLVFPALERRGRAGTPLQRMSAGLFVTVLSFLAAAAVQRLVDLGHPPHVLWQLPQYLLLTVGEVLVAVTGLEFISTQAPRAMRSTIMSVWFLTVVAGNLVTWLVNRLVGLEGAAYFLLFAGLMLAAALAFRLVARRYRGAAAA
jgi:POT family proton-dependent oligopeptide transporter